ncbi:hypothetical protein [Persicirhabdus sediminis]|uniref:PA14 domain-containing protein n=1 Tax=Persicirhabdus sediminis TaxID=454144 RepID=A0A8J7MD93_9BACT|nr:hypothetical protein [Persicirhabdus sediminis]MBK1790486.1 hypothetical protein [Persicirhabdus sediminis]
MSLHAELSPEAKKQLQQQQTVAAISSGLIAVLVVVLCCVALAIMMIVIEVKEETKIVSYTAPTHEVTEIQETRQINRLTQPTPPSPTMSQTKVIAAQTTSSVAISIPHVDSVEIEADFGSGMDFGSDMSFAADFSSSNEAVTGWGSSSDAAGGLEGTFYDFKQNRAMEPRPFDPKKMEHYTKPVLEIYKEKFAPSAFKNHFAANKKLYLNYLAIPGSPAKLGPEYFGVEKEVEPTGWMVHYKGTIQAREAGRYRFIGMGDDQLSVFIDGRMRLEGSWPGLHRHIAGRWSPSRGEEFKSHVGPPLRYGDWITLKEGQNMQIDIAIGERPGGATGFILMIEKQGEEYRKTKDGRPIWPPFCIGKLGDEDKKFLKKFPNWEWETEKVPLFISYL